MIPEEYLVCCTRSGLLFIMTRQQREFILKELADVQKCIESFVLRRFDNLPDAKKFVAEQNAVDSLLEKIL